MSFHFLSFALFLIDDTNIQLIKEEMSIDKDIQNVENNFPSQVGGSTYVEAPTNTCGRRGSVASLAMSECTSSDSVFAIMDMSGSSLPDESKKLRSRRQNYTLGTNRFQAQISELRTFQSNNMNHMIVNSRATKRVNAYEKSFNQFFLLSAKPEELFLKEEELPLILPLSHSSFYTPVHVLDRYPLTAPSSKFLKSEEVASFCFPPAGVNYRFIPMCAKDLAMKKCLIGEEADSYQLHTVR